MNERIKQLIEQATIRGEEYLPGSNGHPTPTVYFDKEKFAELIVRQCQLRVEQYINECGEVASIPNFVIMKHFGVEE